MQIDWRGVAQGELELRVGPRSDIERPHGPEPADDALNEGPVCGVGFGFTGGEIVWPFADICAGDLEAGLALRRVCVRSRAVVVLVLAGPVKAKLFAVLSDEREHLVGLG
eukprot:CAMPEP_0202757776 /NCGR_PEP_ID=MMETSP1388-20130828/16593_1 /ASSEMBLY_ACC=CAM_ASM_000864 /TAXON_ID=37098 /ORGANISM="Isochrysis sp, Strain CCMP1244" /LENGTH=109 /DNA_ID=CAMNT_0049425677 /DNA_START=439 /DNA_END=768 /DNA_ORIENTATION=+